MTSQPGFRFFPTEEELVSFYLHNKLLSGGGDDNLNRAIAQIIPVLDIYAYNPWDLPQKSGEVCNIDHDDPDQQWFFFIPKQESQVRGGKPNRLTTTGYWKATGSAGLVYSTSNNRGIGVKRSMVFYIGRAPKGTKTVWKMNEYKAFVTSTPSPSNIIAISSTGVVDPELLRQEFSLCRVYKKSKLMRAFDRRPPATPPPAVLIGDNDDNDRHEEDGGTNQQHPLHHINNNIGYDQVTTTSDDHVMCQIPVHETPHHNQISNAMINPHNYKNNSVAHDVTAGSSSMEHHIDHNVDDYGDRAAFSDWDWDWDFDWDSYWD